MTCEHILLACTVDVVHSFMQYYFHPPVHSCQRLLDTIRVPAVHALLQQKPPGNAHALHLAGSCHA